MDWLEDRENPLVLALRRALSLSFEGSRECAGEAWGEGEGEREEGREEGRAGTGRPKRPSTRPISPRAVGGARISGGVAGNRREEKEPTNLGMQPVQRRRILRLPPHARPRDVRGAQPRAVRALLHQPLHVRLLCPRRRVLLAALRVPVAQARVVLDVPVAREVGEAHVRPLPEQHEAAPREERGERVGEVVPLLQRGDELVREDAAAVAREVAVVGEGVERGAGGAGVRDAGGVDAWGAVVVCMRIVAAGGQHFFGAFEEAGMG